MSGNASSFRLNLVPLGIPTLIIADDPQLIAAARAAYAHWLAEAPVTDAEIELHLEIGAASSVNEVSLEARVEGSRLLLVGLGAVGSADAGSRRGTATISPALVNDGVGLAEITDTLLLFLLARNGRTPVHASAFMLGDRAIVLAGPSNSGKSTLALAAAQRGYPVLSDDMIFVQRQPSFALWGFPRPIHVFPSVAPEGEHQTRNRGGKIKAAIPLDAPALKTNGCVLVLIRRGTSLALDPIDGSEAVGGLMKLEPGFDLLRQDSRQAAEEIASRGAWKLTLSDDPNAAIDLLVERFTSA